MKNNCLPVSSIETFNLDFTNLHELFVSKKSLLKRYRHKVIGNKKTRHLYWDNNAPILLVSHIDTVQEPKLVGQYAGAGFDDRLGCFVGRELVRRFPQYFDMLWCDYEEIGRSTASFFEPSHKYNFIIELDREGDDYVDYGLADDDFAMQFGLMTGISHSWGSFSDIGCMDHISCSKINLGIGTERSHSAMSWFTPSVCQSQIKALLHFVELYHDQHWPSGPGYMPVYLNTNYSYQYDNTYTHQHDSLGTGYDEELEMDTVYYPCELCEQPTPNYMYDVEVEILACNACKQFLIDTGDWPTMRYAHELGPGDGSHNIDHYTDIPWEKDDPSPQEIGLFKELEDARRYVKDTEMFYIDHVLYMEFTIIELWTLCDDWNGFCADMHWQPDVIKDGVGSFVVNVPVSKLLDYEIIDYNEVIGRGL